MLTNNDILKKIRVALSLKDTDILEILKLNDFEVTKTELSALFRTTDDDRYKDCGDQLLRRFLDGLIIKNRGRRPEDATPAALAARDRDERGETTGFSSRPAAKSSGQRSTGTRSARGEGPAETQPPKRPPRVLEVKKKS